MGFSRSYGSFLKYTMHIYSYHTPLNARWNIRVFTRYAVQAGQKGPLHVTSLTGHKSSGPIVYGKLRVEVN
jgi:hypothetical protein